MANLEDEIVDEFSKLPPTQVRRTFDYDRRLLPNVFIANQEHEVTNLSEAVRQTGLSIGYPAWNLLYYNLLCTLKRKDPVIVETGTNLGFSSIIMAQALKDFGSETPVRTVDINAAVVESARKNAIQAGVEDLIKFSVGDSRDFLRNLTTQFDAIDFAFLDGSHQGDDVIAEFEIIRPQIQAAQGTVFFDNTSSGGVEDALQYIKKTHGGNLVHFSNCSWAPPGNAIWQS